jgi:hypothetical protein
MPSPCAICRQRLATDVLCLARARDRAPLPHLLVCHRCATQIDHRMALPTWLAPAAELAAILCHN